MTAILSRVAALGLTLGIILAIALLVVLPIAREVSELEEEIAGLEHQRDKLATRLSGIETAPEPIFEDQAFLGSASPAQASAELQDLVDASARMAGARIKSFRIEPSKAVGALVWISSVVEIETDLMGLSALLYRLESSQPYVFVDRVSVRRKRSADRSSAGALTLQLWLSGLIRADA